jgi:protein-S-isoprenylcysteine O-methyltransferase Ste14
MSNRLGGSPRVLPPACLLGAFILMVCLHALLPGAQIFRSPFRYIGFLVLGLAFAPVVWAARLFRKAGTTTKPFRESSVLVVDGPYRWSRNPIYLGLVGGLVGIGMLLGSASPFAVIPMFAVVIDRLFIRAEEVALERTFGAAYAAYKARVRRWL